MNRKAGSCPPSCCWRTSTGLHLTTMPQQRSRSCLWMISSHPSHSMSISPPVTEIRLFQILTLKQGQGHVKWPRTNVLLICFLFVLHQSDQQFLTNYCFKIWPWKIQVLVIWLNLILTRTTRMPAFYWPVHIRSQAHIVDQFILDPKSKQDKVKVTNLKNFPKLQIFKFCKNLTHNTPSEVAW